MSPGTARGTPVPLLVDWDLEALVSVRAGRTCEEQAPAHTLRVARPPRTGLDSKCLRLCSHLVTAAQLFPKAQSMGQASE